MLDVRIRIGNILLRMNLLRMNLSQMFDFWLIVSRILCDERFRNAWHIWLWASFETSGLHDYTTFNPLMSVYNERYLMNLIIIRIHCIHTCRANLYPPNDVVIAFTTLELTLCACESIYRPEALVQKNISASQNLNLSTMRKINDSLRLLEFCIESSACDVPFHRR